MQKLIIGLAALALAALAAPGSAFAQPARPEIERASSAAERQAVDRILEIESQGGPHAAGLIEPLKALGLLYAEDGDDYLALAALERARGIVRINYGFSSIEEALVLRQLARTEAARGNAAALWALEQELLALARQHLDDLRTVPMFREIAERRLDTLERYRAGGFPPEIVIGCYYGNPRSIPNGAGGGSCHAGSSGHVQRRLLLEVHEYYSDAIEVMLRNERYSSDELRELEMRAVRMSYANGMLSRPAPCGSAELNELLRMDLVGSCLDPDVATGGGAGLIRLIAYELRSEAPALTLINAIVRLADGQLLTAQGRKDYESTLGLYEWAYEASRQNGLGEASIERIFSPETPVALPVFWPSQLATEQTPESSGYVDVAFDVTVYGESDHVDVLESSASITRAEKRELVRSIKRTRFRPRVTDGGPATSRVVVRYYPRG